MPGIHHNPVYNSRIPSMRISVGAGRVWWPRFASCFCELTWVILLALLSTAGALASDWQIPASQLAQRIAGITGPGAVSITIINRSTLSSSDADDIRRRLLTELSLFGVQSAPSERAASSVEVSLSENIQNYLWIAEIHQGTSEPVVVMVSVPGAIKQSAPASATPLSIQKTLLWSDDNRILDTAVVNGNPQHLIVLEPETIVLLRLQNGQWQIEQSLRLVHVRPWPRDLRGHLVLRKDHLFDAYLPGVLCRSGATSPLAVTCDDSDDPWPLSSSPSELNAFFSSSRNFFTGALSPGIQKQTMAPAFYSAAPLPREKYTLWVFAAVDGQVHLMDGVGDQSLSQLHWGSDIATVRSGCGPGWQLLVTSHEDESSDSVRAFEGPDREPILVSSPAEFSGSITAFWTDAESTSATAVVQNSATGKYEAYRLSIDCHQ